MIVDAALSFAHFTAVFLLVGTLVAEAFVIRLPPSAAMVRLLSRIDLFYGISAGLVIAAGVARVFWGARAASYYAGQPFFWAKMAVFALIGLISIVPTLRFISWRRRLKTDETALPDAADVKSVRRLIMVEAHLLAVVPLFAALMARGIGG
jgi:putative membrane protein